MAWDKELAEKKRREGLAEQMGGDDKVARQHGRGKLDVRQRIHKMADPGSFREIGKLAGKGSYGPEGELEDFKPTSSSAARTSTADQWC